MTVQCGLCTTALIERVNRDAAAAQSNNQTHSPHRDKGALAPPLTFVFILHVLHQQGQVAVVG